MRAIKTKTEGGFVSIVVTMIIMVVLVLITVGFVRIIGREQRQVLDRQLSTQAFYAAEAGVNDAIKALSNPDPTQRYNIDKNGCGPDGSPQFPTGSNNLDSTGNVQYTCLTIDHAPTSLEYGSIGRDNVTLIPISAYQSDGTTPQNITRLRISWQASSGTPTFAGSGSCTLPNFPPTGSWCANTGVLHASLTPLSGPVDRNSLIYNTFTSFLYPQKNGSAGQIGSESYISGSAQLGNQGIITSGKCFSTNTPRSCTVEITNLSGSKFMLALRSIYTNSSVSISGYNGGSGTANPVRLGEAQALVDSTGKAADVLRRIAVRVPTRNDYAYPAFALNTSFEICKTYSIAPPNIADAGMPPCTP